MASILIVDDGKPIRDLLRRILEEDGHQIREAENGEIALILYREAPADLVITDILMPKRDGIEVILALTTPSLLHCPPTDALIRSRRPLLMF